MALTTESAARKDTTSGLGEMQHRHFATVATIIRELDDVGVRQHCAEHFARYLRRTNPRFDEARFLRACGVQS